MWYSNWYNVGTGGGDGEIKYIFTPIDFATGIIEEEVPILGNVPDDEIVLGKIEDEEPIIGIVIDDKIT